MLVPLTEQGSSFLGSSGRALRAVAANRGLRRVQLLLLCATVGRWTNGTAIGLVAVDKAGADGVGVAFATPLISGALAAPLVSVAADRFPRARVLVVVGLALCALALTIAAAVASDLPLAAVIAIQSVIAIVSTVEQPAARALVPSLAQTPEELTAANAVASGIQSVSIVVGPAVAGGLAALSGHSAMFIASATLFGLSALLATMLPLDAVAAEPTEKRLTIAESLAGLHTVGRDRALRLLVGLYAAQTFVGGALNVLIVVAGAELLDLSDSGIGLLISALGVGGIAGTIAAAGLGARSHLARAFAFGLVLWGLALAAIGVWVALAVTIGALAAIGVADAFVDVSVVTLIQRVAPEEVLGRVFGVLESTLLGMIGAGCLLSPVVAGVLGTRGALVFFGLLLPFAVLVTWRGLARLDRPAAAAERVALLRAQPIFAPLPEQAVEALSTRLGELAAADGDVVISEGEAGDLFYVIEDGTVEVSIDGEPVRIEGPGEAFGEVALVRDIPRTATVRARGPVRLLSLERDVFISAVTGHPASAEAADAVAAARLARRPVPLSSP